MLRFSKELSTRVSLGEEWEGGVPVVQEMREPVEAPGHDFISLVEELGIFAAGYHRFLSKHKLQLFPPLCIGLAKLLVDQVMSK